MKSLLEFLNALDMQSREDFASRCGTTLGYLRKAISTNQQLGEGLCINIDRESKGKVTFDELYPGADWAYVRSTKPRRKVAA